MALIGSMPTLLHHPLCPFSRSIRLALAECAIEFELVEERPWEWRPDFLQINPAGSLPVLVRQDEPPICGAYAISEYLQESLLDGGDELGFQLFPGDAEARIETRRLVDWFHRKFNDEVTGYLVDEKVFRRFGPNSSSPDMLAMRAGKDNLRYHLAYIAHLAERRSWLAGESLGFADLAAAAHLSALDYLGEVPWEDYEPVKIWYALLKSRPSFRPLLQDRVAGFTPAEAYVDLDF
jgi:glutathione S-transferase